MDFLCGNRLFFTAVQYKRLINYAQLCYTICPTTSDRIILDYVTSAFISWCQIYDCVSNGGYMCQQFYEGVGYRREWIKNV